MRIYDMFMNNGLEVIVERTTFLCGCKRDFDVTDDYDVELLCCTFEGTLEDYLEDNALHELVEEYDNYKIEGNTLILITNMDIKCVTCKDLIGRVRCIDTPKPVGFEDMVLMHGICALSRTDLVAGIEHVVKVLTDETYETCCSTRPIGPIGIAVKADVITASCIDLYTRVGEDGHRFYDLTEANAKYIVYDAKDLKENEFGINDEMVTINHKLQYVWYDINEATEEEREAALWLADKLGVEALAIEDKQEEDYGMMYY